MTNIVLVNRKNNIFNISALFSKWNSGYRRRHLQLEVEIEGVINLNNIADILKDAQINSPKRDEVSPETNKRANSVNNA